MTLVSAGLAIACAGMSWVGGLLALTLGFLLVRGLGQGALTLVSLHAINIWFRRRRGLAVGIASLGFAIGIAVLPRGIEALISQVGWRQAYRLLGVAVAATILPVGALLFRGSPELFGLQLAPSPAGDSAATSDGEAHYTAAQARRSLVFWAFTLGDAFVSALATGLTFHHFDIMQQTGGLNAETAVAVFAPLGIVSAGANLLRATPWTASSRAGSSPSCCCCCASRWCFRSIPRAWPGCGPTEPSPVWHRA